MRHKSPIFEPLVVPAGLVLLVGSWYTAGLWFGLGAAGILAGVAIWRTCLLQSNIAEMRSHQSFRESELARMREETENALRQCGDLRVQTRVAESQYRRLEGVLNSLNDAVLVTDAFNEVTLANNAAKHLLEVTADAIASRPLDQVVPDAQLVDFIKDVRESGRTQHKHIEHQLKSHGRPGIYDVSLSAITDSESREAEARSRGVVTILRDITRQKEIDDMKSLFVSNVSHELRTPLASIQAYIEMLVDGEVADDSTRSEFYQIMQGEAVRLSRLIENMLNLSRIEAGIMTVHYENVVMPRLVTEVVELLRLQAQEKGLTLDTRLPNTGCQLDVDRDMIFQVLINLIANAIKYTPSGGRIVVGCEQDNDAQTVSVSICDTGAGIAEDEIPRLFEEYYRCESNSHVARGTGLGLSLVRRVVEDIHHGQLSVKSKIGDGSTFTFTLPIAETEV